MRVIKIVLLFWTNKNVWKKFSKPLLKMIGDHSAFRIALRKLPSSLRAVDLCTYVPIRSLVVKLIIKKLIAYISNFYYFCVACDKPKFQPAQKVVAYKT